MNITGNVDNEEISFMDEDNEYSRDTSETMVNIQLYFFILLNKRCDRMKKFIDKLHLFSSLFIKTRV